MPDWLAMNGYTWVTKYSKKGLTLAPYKKSFYPVGNIFVRYIDAFRVANSTCLTPNDFNAHFLIFKDQSCLTTY